VKNVEEKEMSLWSSPKLFVYIRLRMMCRWYFICFVFKWYLFRRY